MTDSQREALTVLAEVLALSPEDIRIGQVMAWLGYRGEGEVGRSLWDIEDDELLKLLCQHREELRARLEDPASGAVQPPATAIPVSGSSALPEATHE
jgi:hypothetical protein